MNIFRSAMLCLVLCFCSSVWATPQATEIKSKKEVALLSLTTVIYDTPNDSKFGFSLRIMQYVGDGECTENTICNKDKIIFVTSSYDEYPDRKAFEVPLNGEYKRLIVVSAPKKENGKYVIRIFYESSEGKELCTEYGIQIGHITIAPACRN